MAREKSVSLEVTVAESNLLRVARAVVGLSSYSEVERLLLEPHDAPTKLGPTAMGLLKDTLGRGVSLALLRGGGWRLERAMRLWERCPLPAMHFQAGSFRLLQWMLRTPLAESGVKALPGKGVASWADEALLALALGTVAGSVCERTFSSQAHVRASALCWVMHPAALARSEGVSGEGPALALTPDAPLTFFLEAWQPPLAKSWVLIERAKGELTDPAELNRIGRAQDWVLSALLGAADSARRRDLLGFLVEAGAQVLHHLRTPDDWVRSLSPTMPLRNRAEARSNAGALLRALVKLKAWDTEHRVVRFFNKEYAASQAMVAAWEVLGDKGFREAARLLSELENPI